jgi:DNA invertase Pin-like site-specific DNA recombinase
MIDLFNKKKVALVSLAESLDTSLAESLDTKSAMGRFFVRMIASLAELERESIGDRTKTGMSHLKTLGMPVGHPPSAGGPRAVIVCSRSRTSYPLSRILPSRPFFSRSMECARPA